MTAALFSLNIRIKVLFTEADGELRSTPYVSKFYKLLELVKYLQLKYSSLKLGSCPT